MPTSLSDALAANWLPGDDGPHAGSVAESADAFSLEVSNWYASAMAGAFPVATAQTNRGVLTGLATIALNAREAAACGTLLSVAVMAYMTGQLFGSGTSTPPIAQPAAAALFTLAFDNLDLDRDARAQLIALGVFLLAISTIVVFVGPPFTAPVF